MNSAQTTITVNSLPPSAAIQGGAASVCAGSTTPTFTNAMPGGVWSVTNSDGSASITGEGVVTGLTAGTVTVVYTVTNTNNCSKSVTKPLTVSSMPVVSISGNTTICVNKTTALSPATGGTWVSNNESAATVTNDGTVTGVAAGSATFTFTETATGCSNTTTTAVTVNRHP